jgi:hypothetical protein
VVPLSSGGSVAGEGFLSNMLPGRVDGNAAMLSHTGVGLKASTSFIGERSYLETTARLGFFPFPEEKDAVTVRSRRFDRLSR